MFSLRKYLIAQALFLSLHTAAYSQQPAAEPVFRPYKETSIRLLIGGNLQQAKDEQDKEFSRKYLEAGIHFTTKIDLGQHPAGVFTHGLSLELAPGGHGNQPVYGIKYGAWVCANLFVLGINAVYYTDWQRGNFKIRPEFGFGVNATRLTFGINIPTISNTDFFPLKKSLMQLSLTTLLKVKTVKRTEMEPYRPGRP